MKRIRQKAFEKSREAELNQTKSMELQASLAETERIAKFEISNMKNELMSRRDKVYELLDKLQATEDKLRASKDLAERQQELLDSSEERGRDLDRRLNDVRAALAKREEELFLRQDSLKKAEDGHANKIETLQSTNDELEGQLSAASQKILELVDRHELNQETKRRDDELHKQLAHEHELTRDQNQRLMESLNEKSRQHIQLEGDHKDAQNLIRELKAQQEVSPRGEARAVGFAGGGRDATEIATSGSKRGTTTSHRKMLAQEAAARRKLFENFVVSLCHSTIVSDAIENKCIVEARSSLVLDNCHIDDVDMITLVSILKGSKTITDLNLVSNRIGDAGAAALASLISLGNCRLNFIDLRNNFITMSGIKRLAEAMQSNKGRCIEHVYVHNDGKIDAIGLKVGAPKGGSSNQEGGGNKDNSKDPFTLAKLKNAMSSICVVDVRENFPDNRLPAPVGTQNTLWEKLNASLPSEESLKINAAKKKALRQRRDASQYRDALVGKIYS